MDIDTTPNDETYPNNLENLESSQDVLRIPLTTSLLKIPRKLDAENKQIIVKLKLSAEDSQTIPFGSDFKLFNLIAKLEAASRSTKVDGFVLHINSGEFIDMRTVCLMRSANIPVD